MADPVNLLDEVSAAGVALTGLNGSESVWDSDRRFGDILHNTLEQNRAILANDDAEYPWYRFEGQLASGLIFPVRCWRVWASLRRGRQCVAVPAETSLKLLPAGP